MQQICSKYADQYVICAEYADNYTKPNMHKIGHKICKKNAEYAKQI
jgi:hypothetical protein